MALTVALVLAVATACTGDDRSAKEPARPVAVKLTADAPDRLTIGVVVSLAAAPGEGAEWRDAAEGAEVATRRFQMGGTKVALEAANDKGTVAGAAAAVATLARRGVAGIVIATSGDHVEGALTEAAAKRMPILLPYAESADDLPDGAWLTGPDRRMVDARLVEALRDRGVTRPYMIDAGGGAIDGLSASGRSTFRAGDDPVALVKALSQRLARPEARFDAVAISGPAQLQANLVRALQGSEIDMPFFLTPQALSPIFPVALSKAEGSQSSEFVSAGLNNDDPAALDSSAAGRAVAAYLAGLRLTAADAAAKNLFGDRPFSAVSGAADVRSHDAVVALVRSAAAAGSTDPVKVGDALSGLRLDTSDGVAGPPLDFSSPTAVSDGAVVALAAAQESGGLRPTPDADSPTLSWFPLRAS